jgi:uncharacterized membrane protein YfcA
MNLFFPNLSFWSWLGLFSSAFFIGMAKGGIKGTGLLVIPVMAILFGGKVSSGIVLPMLLFADLFAVRHYRGHTDWGTFWKLIPMSFFGILIGHYLGMYVSDNLFKLWMAGIVFGSLLLMILQTKGFVNEKMIQHPVFASVIGLLGGFSTMIGNAAGPVMSVYLLGLKLPKLMFIGTSAWFYLSVNIMKLPFHIFSWKTIHFESLILNLYGIPFLLLGFFSGAWIINHLEEKSFRNLVIWMTFLAAIRLLLDIRF